jgi:N-acetylglucosaminyldiphosphoundecaprenol N-acetyl-beta-D-mannosaminyltransferase
MKIGEKSAGIRILDTRVDMVRMADVMALMEHWIETEPHKPHHVVNTGMHGIMEAHKDPAFAAVLDSADLLAPDGVLAILVSRIHGYHIKKRETGPGLLWQFSEAAHRNGYKYFFYGDTVETLDLLSDKLLKEFPGLKIVGLKSPPFRRLTPDEDAAMVARINEAKPDVLWVGLGMPKQERWIFEHRQELNVPVVVGAGASFKFISGTVQRAPALVSNLGFEWLWRLVHEPKRVWRRVIIDAPQFIVLVLLQLIRQRKLG